MNHRVDISHKTIFFIAGFLALLWALFLIKDVIILLFVAIILMSGLSPIVASLQKFLRLPKGLAIALAYLLIIGILALLITLVVTPLIDQTANLVTTLPNTITHIIPAGLVDKSILQQELGNVSKNALAFTLGIFNNFIAFVSVAVLTAYLLIERDKLDKLAGQFFIGREERVRRILEKIEDKLGAWLRGQVVLSLIIGSLSYVTLLVLGIPFAIPLAVLAGIMEVVPVIGPIISAIPAILIAYTINPVLALIVAGCYLVIQQLENHFVVPQVMKKAVGLNPLIVILAVAAGGRLLGVAGALLAVPITAVVQIITEDILREESEQ